MFEQNEEQLKKWGNSIENKDMSNLCPILTAEENLQQNDDYNVQLQLEKENIFRLPVPWRKKDDHPYKASIQPIEPISFTPNPDFPQPKLPALGENNKECACTCQCKTISNPMGQIGGNQQILGYTHPLGPTSSIQTSPLHLTQPHLWKEDEEETICTCPKVPLPLIKPEPKRVFVKCECNELIKNLAPTNYKCPKPQPEVKMAQFLSKEDMKAASKALEKEVDKSRQPKKHTKSSERVKTKDVVCCCCAESKNKQENEKKKEKSNADDRSGKVETRGGDDNKVVKKHRKPETITVKKKLESKDKNIKGGQKKKTKDISKDKKKVESKKKEKDNNNIKDSLQKSGPVSKQVSLDTKIESTKSKSKNVNKLVVDQKPSSKQESRDTALVDEGETSKKIKSKQPESDKSKPKKSKTEKSERKKFKSGTKDKKSKKITSEKKEYIEKRSIDKGLLKKIDELVNKQETNLIESDFTKGMYPGTTVGHATCCLPFIRVPNKMGWLWNICEGAGRIKPDLGWRPGAIRASTFATMKASRNLNMQNKQFDEEEDIDEGMEEEDEAGNDHEEAEDDTDLDEDEDDESEEDGDVKTKRKRAKLLVKDDEQEDVTKPTLHLHKTKGQYYISMYTPEDKEKKNEDEGRVLVSFNRKTLELGSSVTGSMSGQSSTVTEDSMEFDYTTPFALYKQSKRPEKSNAQTQWKKM